MRINRQPGRRGTAILLFPLALLVACGEATDESNADLIGLEFSSHAPLSPAFAPDEASYQLDLSVLLSEVSVTATALDATATIFVNGVEVDSGLASPPITLDVGENVVTVRVLASNGVSRTYLVEVTRGLEIIKQVAYAKASNTDAGDRFGSKVAVSGDTLAVGADFERSKATGVDGNQTDNTAENSGAVYVFRRHGTTWVQEAYLKASNAEAHDHFGFSVALSGDTLAVGAIFEDSNAIGVGGNQSDNSAENSGAVYVFRRSGATWSQQAYIKASNADAGDNFGFGGVALSGDTLAVGAIGEDSSATGAGGNQDDNSAPDSGAVYVFRRSGTTWAQEAYLKASNAEFVDGFGFGGVAIFGDTLAVGAVGEDSSATGVDGNQTDNMAERSGAVYVFQRSGTSWVQEAYLKAPNSEAGDEFGSSMAVFSDTLVVGAVGEDSDAMDDQADNTAESSGAVYVFRRNGSSWSQEAYLKASNTEADDCFGSAVALSDDMLAVGALREDSGAGGVDSDQADNTAINAGAVYLFRRSGSTWSQEAYLKASNPKDNILDGVVGDNFGFSVALSGDTLAVGAKGEGSKATGVNGDQEDDSAGGAGAVYLFQ